MTTFVAYFIVALLAGFVAAADYLLKIASLESRPIANWWFLSGSVIYLMSAFGWVHVMPHIKLSSLGLVYSLCTVIFLAGLGVFAFGETLSRNEVAGLVLGVVSIILLARFGN